MNLDDFFSEDYDIICSWIDKGTYGDYHIKNRQMRINVDLLIIDTFLHEYFHHKYPDMSERGVDSLAIRARNKMKVDDIKSLSMMILKKIL